MAILFCTTAFLSSELAKIPSNLENIEGHGHKYLVLSDDDFKKLDKVNTTVTKPRYPGAFTTTTIAATGKYQKELMEFYTYQKAEMAAKGFLQKSFDDTGVLYDMEDHNYFINSTPLKILKHLWDTISEHEKEQEINKFGKILDIEWDADEPIQKYMTTLQDARFRLRTLKADPKTPKIIQKVICAMEKHTELDKIVRD